MSCGTTTLTGITACLANDGGLGGIFNRVKITRWSNIVDWTVASPSGEIDSFNMESGTVFTEYWFKKDVSTFTQEKGVNGGVTQTLTLVFNVITKPIQDAIEELFQEDVTVLVQMPTGAWFLFGGENGMESKSAVITPGTAGSDIPSITLTITGFETSFALATTAGAVLAAS
jgi:hypothetical protein